MRHLHTPIFKSVLTSRLWAMPDATIRVWLWLQLMADPEGYVPADVAGVAVGARVDGSAAREALDVLGLPDADAEPGDPFEGRLIERVTKGWRVLGFEGHRELARQEARRAKRRRYMRVYRGTPAENDVVTDELPTDQSKCDSSVTPTGGRGGSGSGSGSGSVVVSNAREATVQQVVHRVLHQFPESWVPSAELRQDAIAAGVLKFDQHFASLKLGPIGGVRGVFEHELGGYIRSLLGTWRVWEETERAKATQAAKPRAQSYRAQAPTLDPTSKHRAYAKKHNIDLDALVRDFAERRVVDELGAGRALELLGQAMAEVVRKRKEAA